MKPEYANTFGMRKIVDKDGNVLELMLDVGFKYMETSVVPTAKGLENVTTPAADQIASIVMNRQSAIALRNLLIQTLGTDT